MSRNQQNLNIHPKIAATDKIVGVTMLEEEVEVFTPDEDVQTVAERIIERGQQDAFYVCNLSDVVWKYKNWRKIMPRIQPFYAVKCNNNLQVLMTLASLGCNFDCASKAEISTVLSLGVHPDRIVYANPMKKETHLEYAANVGVNTMTFDCVDELQKVKQYHPNARLLLRIRHDDKTATFVFGNKYGVGSEAEAEYLLSVARLMDLDVVGVCFHVGSCCNNITTYEEAIASARKIFDMAATFGYRFTMLDIGGGYPGDKKSSIDKMGTLINTAIEKHFQDKSVQIIAEPGRYIVASAFTLYSRINTKKVVEEEDSTNHQSELIMYYLDVGIFNSLMMTLFNFTFNIRPMIKDTENRNSLPSIIWGPTCTSLDIVTNGVEYLPEMWTGEWIAFDDAGAYTTSMAGEFNGFSKPEVYVILMKQDRALLEDLADNSISMKENFKPKSIWK